ncbi:amidohydrolase [Acetobacter aceti NRIC 0242]|uniref:Organophopsphate acid anhydrase n=1 Tax=Acetobacter aceti NBRC 14818 TaxID=887700 RepID=A0AB33IB17_ACEAC|nr:imidazolonepropionase-like amidohydrolase [Acetobacter aceti NBRC 14818]BCK75505.1 organophopsphate acid anhydrase [Acetobacter aceti NBRC 14818]GAN58758.1 amidohydrolase [Acetobacter aceti NBRC 14818]GBO80501.1 amidohydrolase [Acetobacter aceti NRIC 0242]
MEFVMRRFYLATAAVLLSASPALADSSPVTALTHVRIIDGTEAPPVEDATLVMQGGRILAAGKNISIPKHARILDRSGDTVLPGIISDHSHVGQYEGVTTGPQFYTRPIILSELEQYRRYGVTTVTALGNNAPDVFDPLRHDAHAGKTPSDLFGVDQGIGVPKGAPPVNVAADQLFRPKTPEEARRNVDTMADEGTDLIKIWVDDFDGTLPVKMSPEVISAVVDESHKRNLRVAAHIHDLDDAEHVVAAGVDILAHGIRDQPVPPALIEKLKSGNIWYIATLQLDEASTAWADQSTWTKTPFTIAGLSMPLLQQVSDPAWQQKHTTGKLADFARTSLAMNLQNLKTLYDAGVRVGFGTDSGAMPFRVPGVAEHRELALTVQAGLTPLTAIHIATQNAADLLHLSDRGVIAAGKRADLLVVSGNPAVTIGDTDRIVETWENGTAVAGPIPLNSEGKN